MSCCVVGHCWLVDRYDGRAQTVFHSGCYLGCVIGKLSHGGSLGCNVTQLMFMGISRALSYSEAGYPVSASSLPLGHGDACESSLID